MSTLPNASSFNPLANFSFTELYGDVTQALLDRVELSTEGSMFPEGFRDVQVWRDLSNSMDEVLGTNVASLIRDLFGINELGYLTTSPTIAKQTLLQRARGLGITYDLNTFEDEDIRNFIRYAPQFWKEKGNRNFIQYASFVINAPLTMDYLWSEDYDLFFKEGSTEVGTPVYNGGTFYPTSHVFISYDSAKFSNSVNANFTNQQALTKFFYSIAPINLVIKNFTVSQDIWIEPLLFAGGVETKIWQVPLKVEAPVTTTSYNIKDKSANVLLINASTTAFGSASAPATAIGSIRSVKAETSRKVYLEFFIDSMRGGDNYPVFGLGSSAAGLSTNLGTDANGWGFNAATGVLTLNGVAIATTGVTFSPGDYAGICWDPVLQYLWVSKNNTWISSGNPSAGTSPLATGVMGTLHAMATVCHNESLITLVPITEYKYTKPTGSVIFGS